jgi:prepilin-type N-terminal cleavage/methylation domain-containing protein
MSINLNRKGSGFTIIEVVLVLAIASIIFLLVFLAVPALQASQRDTARKNDAARVVTALANLAGNNSGSLTSATTTNLASYAGTLSANSTITSVTAFAATALTVAAVDGNIVVQYGAKCSTTTAISGKTVTLVAGTNSNAAVIVGLETGNTAFCQSL